MIRCQQTPEVGTGRIHPQYTPWLRQNQSSNQSSACRPFIINPLGPSGKIIASLNIGIL